MEKENRRNEIFILIVIGLVFAIAIVVILLLFSGKKVYKISFDTQTNTKVDMIEVKKGEPFNLPTVTREGYEFKGWYIGNELVDGNYTITKDSVLTAKWEIKTFTVTFNSDGGSYVDSIKVNYNDKLVLPSQPTKSGYTFVSWVDELGAVYKGGETITSDTSLKATWKANSSSNKTTSTFKVSFNSNGGSSVSAITVTCGNNLPVLSTPTRSGYTFVSWTDSNGNTVQSGQKLSCNNVTLIAKWQSNGSNPVVIPTPTVTVAPTVAPTQKPVVTPTPTATSEAKTKMTITFDSAGGTPVSSLTFDCSSGYPRLPSPTRSGYAFMYWQEKKTHRVINSGTPLTKCEDIVVVAGWYQIPTGPASSPKTGDVYDESNTTVGEVIKNIGDAIRRSF